MIRLINKIASKLGSYVQQSDARDVELINIEPIMSHVMDNNWLQYADKKSSLIPQLVNKINNNFYELSSEKILLAQSLKVLL